MTAPVWQESVYASTSRMAAELGMSVRWLEARVRERRLNGGGVPVVLAGNRLRFPRAQVRRWFERAFRVGAEGQPRSRGLRRRRSEAHGVKS